MNAEFREKLLKLNQLKERGCKPRVKERGCKPRVKERGYKPRVDERGCKPRVDERDYNPKVKERGCNANQELKLSKRDCFQLITLNTLKIK